MILNTLLSYVTHLADVTFAKFAYVLHARRVQGISLTQSAT